MYIDVYACFIQRRLDMNYEERIKKIVGQLTLDEKLGMIHGDQIFATKGVERLQIPPLVMSDGPMGVRREFHGRSWVLKGTTDDYVTYLPSNTALASTWNRKLSYETGKVLGCEARGRGKDVILAPGINLKRSPLCGRNFEYMSEDPKLVEEICVPLIKGIQENDVAACVKHFAVNNQETDRFSVDTYLDERTLRELYLPAFYAAVKQANSYTIMGAYNKFRGEQCCESKQLLNDILRDEWKYDGTIISDWGGVHDTKAAAESALDIEMSVYSNFDDYFMANPLKEAILSGEIKEEHIDEKVSNILRLMFRLRMIGEEAKERQSGTYNTFEHQQAVLNVARESIVLLKNEEARLPMNKKGLKKLAVIGQNGKLVHSNGGGSAEIKALYEVSPLLGIKQLLGGNVAVEYADGYYIPWKDPSGDMIWQANSLEEMVELEHDPTKPNLALKKEETKEVVLQKQEKLLKEAVELAKTVDEVILFCGLDHDYDVEGADKRELTLPYEQERLIQQVLEVNPNTVVVVISGSPISYRTFANRAKAIVWTSYIGSLGGVALAETLFGKVNPSGKLPETFVKQLEDCPAIHFGEFGTNHRVTYQEGIYVGYRYFDTYEVEPEFCFGHGLSYTTFEYSNAAVINEDNLILSVDITNTGEMEGAEVVQAYVSYEDSSVEHPQKELKGFEKVSLQPKETKKVTITIPQSDLCYFNITKRQFERILGRKTILLGSSSRDIRCEIEI